MLKGLKKHKNKERMYVCQGTSMYVMRSFNSNETIHKKEDGSYYVVSERYRSI